jgi:DNA-binding XRE family transcriptional regulator
MGELLKTRREMLGLTQRSLASKLGVEASHVAFIENGRRRPSLKLVGRIADTLGFDRLQILILAHPETREFLTMRNSESGSRKMSPCWKRFMKARKLLVRYHVTDSELRVLERLSLFGTAPFCQGFSRYSHADSRYSRNLNRSCSNKPISFCISLAAVLLDH